MSAQHGKLISRCRIPQVCSVGGCGYDRLAIGAELDCRTPMTCEFGNQHSCLGVPDTHLLRCDSDARAIVAEHKTVHESIGALERDKGLASVCIKYADRPPP